MSQLIKIKDISPDENQPRKMFAAEKLVILKESIKKYGVKVPIVVEEISEGKYLLEDGERRFRACVELGLKEIPAVVEKAKRKSERLIQQFHIQEMHEGWTALEKAVAVADLSDELGVPLNTLASMLGISTRSISTYTAFSKLINKDLFQRSNISIDWAHSLANLKAFTKKIYQAEIEEEFDRNMEKRLEGVVIKHISDGTIVSTRDVIKLKDSFKKDPKSIDAFLKGDISPNSLFIKTKAKGAYIVRNIVNSSGFLNGHVSAYMKNPDVKIEKNQLSMLKQSRDSLVKLIKYIEDNEA